MVQVLEVVKHVTHSGYTHTAGASGDCLETEWEGEFQGESSSNKIKS